MMFLSDLNIVFEGLAHPYKDNIVKFAGKPHIPSLPQVKQAFANSKND